MAVGIYTKQVVDGEQSVFKTDKPFALGQHNLSVYVNGMYATVDDQYIEVDPLTIKFKEPLEDGDTILITSSAVMQLVNVDFALVGSGEDVLFKRFDDEIHLKNNQQYTLGINLLDKEYGFKFTSKYSPLYSTIKLIRNDLQDIIENVPDDTINFTIWQNSLLAQEIASSNTNSTTNALTDEVATTPAKYFVRYQTEIDLVYAIYLAISGKASKSVNKLGNIQFELDYTLPDVKTMLDELKKKLAQYERALSGIGAKGSGFLKAGNTSYPVNDRRSF
jgi:hypothetical protein